MNPTESALRYQEVRRRIVAAMETGNPGRAREVFQTFELEDPAASRALQAEIVGVYNVSL